MTPNLTITNGDFESNFEVLKKKIKKPLKVPSLARSVPKPLLIELREAGGHQPGTYEPLFNLRCRPPTHCEMNEMSKFWVFEIYETFICYRRCLNLSCYISKKVQKNFLMGLKIW